MPHQVNQWYDPLLGVIHYTPCAMFAPLFCVCGHRIATFTFDVLFATIDISNDCGGRISGMLRVVTKIPTIFLGLSSALHLLFASVVSVAVISAGVVGTTAIFDDMVALLLFPMCDATTSTASFKVLVTAYAIYAVDVANVL